MSKSKKHWSLAEIARYAAESNWGYPAATKDEALADLARNKGLGDACLLDLVRRLDVVCQALWRDVRNEERQQEEQRHKQRPEWAVPFPTVNVGDSLWSWDELEGPIDRYLVVAKDEDGHVRIVPVRDNCDQYWSHSVTWGGKDHFLTVAEAMKKLATSDRDYYKPRLAFAEQVLAAIARGDDLTPFMGGMPDGEDGEA